MRLTKLSSLLALACLASAARADAPAPGSVLVFPVHDSAAAFTMVSVANTGLAPSSSIRVLFQYVNSMPNPANPLMPLMCTRSSASKVLTPADLTTVLTACQNGAGRQGFLLVSALSAQGGTISHNHLVGSELVLSPNGTVWSLVPFAFASPQPDGAATDLDFDGRMDFDGLEYEALPETLVLDSYLGLGDSRLVLLNFTGDLGHDVAVKLNVWNDDEYPMSLTLSFRCWFQVRLSDLSGIFTQAFLLGTPHDPDEFDFNCDGTGQFELGWAEIDALTAGSGWQTVPNPAILGAVTAGVSNLEGGRLLWGKGSNTSAAF